MRLRDPEWVFLFSWAPRKAWILQQPYLLQDKTMWWTVRMPNNWSSNHSNCIGYNSSQCSGSGWLTVLGASRVESSLATRVRTYVRGTGKVIFIENAIQLILWFGHSLARQSSYQNSLKHSLNSRVHTAYRCTYAWKFKKQSAVQFLIVVQNCTIVDYSGLFWIHIR